ncbi:MAG: metal-dependent hydrolase [Thermoplasmata archaeon]
MKGITHFLTGIAIATCFASAVEAALFEKSLIILLGGIFGILPDTLDFRLTRYLEKHTYEVDPYPDLDPKPIAETMARAIDEAWETSKPVNVKFHTIKHDQAYWRQYFIRIDKKNKTITARIGGLIPWADEPPLPGSEPDPPKTATASFKPDLDYFYDEETKVSILSGPDFEMRRDGNKVRLEFIPWHRRWTHSLSLGLLLGAIGALVFSAIYGFSTMSLVVFGIITGGFWGHVIVDFFGLMGSNLFPPFTKKRIKGLGLCRSSDALPNFFTNYTLLLIIIWNLDAFSGSPKLHMPWVDMFSGITAGNPVATYWVGTINYVLYFIVVPLILIYLAVYILTGKYKEELKSPEELDKERAAELTSEISEEVKM